MVSFQDKIEFLKRNGWTEKSPVSFVKDGYEIWWDTSHWVEIYPDNEIKSRIEDVQIDTLEDLQKLIDRLKRK